MQASIQDSVAKIEGVVAQIFSDNGICSELALDVAQFLPIVAAYECYLLGRFRTSLSLYAADHSTVYRRSLNGAVMFAFL